MSVYRALTSTEEGDRSLWKNHDFLRFFFGQFVSNAGDSLYTVAILWLVFELSGSTFLTGVADSLLLLPFLLQIIGGPIVDRLPLVAYTGNLIIELILMIIPALSLMTLVVALVRAELVPRLVAEDLTSAVFNIRVDSPPASRNSDGEEGVSRG